MTRHLASMLGKTNALTHHESSTETWCISSSPSIVSERYLSVPQPGDERTSHYLPDTFSARSLLFIHPACPPRSSALMLAPDASGILNILWPSFPCCCWQSAALFVRSLYFPLSLEVSDCHRFSLLPGRCFAERGRCKYCRGMPTIGGGGDVRQLPICWIVRRDELCVYACAGVHAQAGALLMPLCQGIKLEMQMTGNYRPGRTPGALQGHAHYRSDACRRSLPITLVSPVCHGGRGPQQLTQSNICFPPHLPIRNHRFKKRHGLFAFRIDGKGRYPSTHLLSVIMTPAR